MHIKFNRVILHNFMSFGHAELPFNDDGFILVSGINQNPLDLATSNGSGKSSLWESIIWALTGDTIRGTKQVVNMFGSDGTYVLLDFQIDNKEYSILRSKEHSEHKTNLKIMIDGKDCSGKGIRDSEKLLLQYLPDITASLLGSVVILGQGLPQKFSNNSPSGRKEVLEKLSKSDFMIEDLKERVGSRKSELSAKLREAQDGILMCETSKKNLECQIEDASKKLSELDADAIRSSYNSGKTVYEELHKKLEEVSNYIVNHNSQIHETNEKLVFITETQNQQIAAVNTQYEVQINSLRDDISTCNAELRAQKSQLEKMRSVVDVCPTCGQKIPTVVKPDTSSIEEQIILFERRLNTSNSQLSDLLTRKDSEIKSINNSVSAQKSEYESLLHSLRQELYNAEIEQRQLQAKSTTAREQMDTAMNELAHLEATIESLTKVISGAQSRIVDVNKGIELAKADRDDLQMRLDVISKFDTALKRDFRGYLLSTIIQYIERRAKHYTKVIFDTDKIGFYLDGNNIEITYLDKSYENLSGGEKQKIDLIVQFSIRDMLCNHLGFTSNILVLDEVFDGLDNTGCQKVLDVISNFNDIKNIFIVTHRKDLSIPSDRELVVIKSPEGISEIKQ